MGKWVMVGLALGVGVLAGCGVLDWATGAGTPENPGTGPGPISTVAPIADIIVPGSGAVIAGLAGLYAEMRRRKWKAAALAQAEALYEARGEKDASGNIPEAKLIEAQIKAQEEYKVRDLVRALVKKIEA